jgi:DHA1 family inner membrane transport protein
MIPRVLQAAPRGAQTGSLRLSVSAPAAAPRTDWLMVALLVGGGVAMALHVGKMPPALPVLRAELGIGLEAAGWLVSLTNLTGAVCALALALFAGRLGYGRLIVGGALVASAASFAAPLLDSLTALFICRFLEGLGFIVSTVSVPPVLVRFVTRHDQRLALAIWSAYLPAGAGGIMMVAAALPAGASWHALWFAAAAASLATAVVLPMTVLRRAGTARGGAHQRLSWTPVATVLQTPGLLLLGTCFALYAGSWYAVIGLLPVLQVEHMGFDRATAALVTSLVVILNVLGNIAAGWLLHHGVHRAPLLAGTATMMALCSAGIFPEALPAGVRLGLAFVFSTFGGMIPGALFAGVPFHARRVELVGVANGLVAQITNIGSLLGPPVTGLLVTHGGWPAAVWYTATALGLILVLAVVLGAIERRSAF